MLNVTLKFTFYCVFLFLGAQIRRSSALETKHLANPVSGARIDSAYFEIRNVCETRMVYPVPKMVDSILKNEALLLIFLDANNVYSNADKKLKN